MNNPAAASSTMTPAERTALQRALSSAIHYLEYGAGESTRLAVAQATLQTIVSVESDPAYIESALRTQAEIRQAEQAGRLKFLIADIGPTQKWGKPMDESKRHLWPAYALCPYRHGYMPDTILIDGRFRVACGILAALQCPPAATILIHDYCNRPQYHVLSKFLDITETADHLVVCHAKAQVDTDRANKLLSLYLYEPRDADPRPFTGMRALWKRLLRKLGRHPFKTPT